MSPNIAFLMDVAFVVVACVMIVAYMSKSLRMLLTELCGTAERASFWVSFSNIVLVLVPLIFALGYKPEVEASRNSMLEMAVQFKHGLIGFVVTLTLLAVALMRFIPNKKSSV